MSAGSVKQLIKKVASSINLHGVYTFSVLNNCNTKKLKGLETKKALLLFKPKGPF